MASRIAFVNKILNVISALPVVKKWRFEDANEVKSVVNSHANDIEGLENGKEPAIPGDSVTKFWTGIKTWVEINKAYVALGNVDNTADINKELSTPQETKLQPIPVPVPSLKTFDTADGSNGTYYSTGVSDVNYTINTGFLSEGKFTYYTQENTGKFTFIAGTGTIVQVDDLFQSSGIGAQITVTKVNGKFIIGGDLI